MPTKISLRIISLLCCMLSLCVSIVSAPLSYEVVPTEIAFDTENRIFLQDKSGLVWIGTEFGFDVYDCNGQKIFSSQSELPHQFAKLSVTSFFETGDSMWIGEDKGLYIFDRPKNTFEKFNRKTRYGVAISSRVRKFLKGQSNKIWIATQGQGLFIYDLAKGELSQDSRHGSFYSDLALGADGLVYAVTYQGKIQSFRQNGDLVREYDMPDYVGNKHPFYLASSGRDIWVAAGDSLFRISTDSGSVAPMETPGLRGTANTLLRRQDGNLIISTEDGIWQYSTVTGDFKEIRYQRLHNLHEGGSIASIAENTEGNIIIVRPNTGIEIMMIQPGAIRFVKLSENSDLPVKSVVRSFASSPDGKYLWVGSDKGISLYNLTTGKFESLQDPGLQNIHATSLALAGDELWIGTKSRGVFRHNIASGETRHYTYHENVPYSLISNEINDIGITSGGDVYILTNWGVCHYDKIHDNFPQFTEIGQNVRATSFREDKNGTLWIETDNNGILRKNPGERSFGRIEDDEKKAFPDNNRKPDFDLRRYGDYNPMASRTIHLDNGLTAMGANGGFLIIDSARLKSSGNSTIAYASAISIPFIKDGISKLRKLGKPLAPGVQNTIKIPYGSNTFTIQISGIHPLANPDIKFDYMMKGVDKDWITGANVPEVTYSNLSPGSYEFLVRPHGMDNAEIKTLRVEVTPPWYLSIWAVISYILLALLAGWGFYVALKKIIERKKIKEIKEFQKMQERETFEAKTRYFVDLVHEIRTPLMLISMPLEQLGEELDKAKKASDDSARNDTSRIYVKSMQENVDYLLGITNQLLDFRKAEKMSEVKLNLYRFDLCVLIRKICHRFEEPLKLNKKHLECQLPDEEVWIKADVDKIERVMMNLIGNAMKYAESEIRVSLDSENPENVTIIVADDGVGIPKEERKMIFDTYYQIKSPDVSVSIGTGLGLAYARLITEAHHGTISVGENTDGKGALFELVIPRESGCASGESLELPEYEYNPEAPEPQKQDITILLVEDNKDLRDMITRTLGKYYSIVSAQDGVEALEILKDNNVDVIVSDVMMERMNGLELCRRVKNDIEYSHIPFIILTALTTEEAHEEGLSCGADVYLEKPFPIKQLVLQIENLLRTRRLLYDRFKNSTASTPGENSSSASPQDPNAETSDNSAKGTGLNKLDLKFLEKMNEIIAEAIENEDFSIDILAQNLNMSRSSFYRKITAVTGMSPNEYLKNFRLNKAAELLREGCRVSEVSELVGFTSSSYFAKCFRAKFGVLPSEFK